MANKDKNTNRDRFEKLLRDTERDGIDYVLEDLDALGFFEAPASKQGHGAYAGGLVEHSLNVYDAACDLRASVLARRPDLAAQLPEASIAIAALLHDVCKSNFYKLVRRKRRNEIGTFEESLEYEIQDQNFPVGHGEKSVIMLLGSGLDMTDDEILAVRWHMGPWSLGKDDEKFYRQSHKNTPLPAIIHTADTVASALLERPGATL